MSYVRARRRFVPLRAGILDPMDAWNVVSTTLGLGGAIAGVSAALWVFRKEREERRVAVERQQALEEQHRVDAAKQAADASERDDKRATAEAERDARAIRRLKHTDDYREAAALLERLKDIAYKVEIRGLLTRTAAGDCGLNTMQREFEKLGDRLPQLMPSLFHAGHIAWALNSRAVSDDVDSAMLRAIRDGAEQVVVAHNAAEEIAECRRALDKEWEA
jgi:hypothetical protein